MCIETSGVSGDTRIWLYEDIDSQLHDLDSDDDTGEGLFSRLVEFDLAPGNYFVEVQEYYNDEEIAAYHLSVTSLLARRCLRGGRQLFAIHRPGPRRGPDRTA